MAQNHVTSIYCFPGFLPKAKHTKHSDCFLLMKCRQEDYTATEASCFFWLIGWVFYYFFSPSLIFVLQLSTRVPSHGEMPSVYSEAKLVAQTYQSVKQQLFKAFQKAGLGTWVKKPPEQDQFLLTV